jgi:hypothetical protein
MVAKLRAFDEPVYFHQVIASYGETQPLRRFKDLPDALQFADTNPAESLGEEWRVHFHIPLHAPPWDGFQSTQDHLLGAMDWLSKNPPNSAPAMSWTNSSESMLGLWRRCGSVV